MSLMEPQSTVPAMTVPAGLPQPTDRRRHKRLSVTVAARVIHDTCSYRTRILDVSDGGMLLAGIDALTNVTQQIVQIDAAAIGRIKGKVICVSPIGLHIEVSCPPEDYQSAIERLSNLTRIWNNR